MLNNNKHQQSTTKPTAEVAGHEAEQENCDNLAPPCTFLITDPVIRFNVKGDKEI